ncbi:unnamed protein product [Toxocara canis]|uniref:Glyco_hydro_35 domain-containing protein n=1 Tax=Toxocara canis TaxID=6265 RepID=A0A183UM36_TOXCA|nr:unnamed protein product [Toxocara canis]
MRAAGLNAIQFYIPWNFHEVYEGISRFDGSRNVTHFLSLAAGNELYALVRYAVSHRSLIATFYSECVTVFSTAIEHDSESTSFIGLVQIHVDCRIGPYICGEWENGGLPWWLLKYENIRMRTSDVRFLDAVKKWFDVLLPQLKPSLRKNGGPILMLQVENEYGSFAEGCDQAYTTFLRDLTRKHLGDDVLLYTTDGADDHYLRCGSIPGVFTTVDFGPTSRARIDSSFAAQRRFEPDGPLVNSEFYPGWIVTWHQKGRVDPSVHDIMNGSMYMFELGASFNYYMFFGGTNFAFWNGAETTSAVITSYDYFAPLTEAADISEKFIAIRDWIKNIEGWPNPPKSMPKNNPYVLNFYHHNLLLTLYTSMNKFIHLLIYLVKLLRKAAYGAVSMQKSKLLDSDSKNFPGFVAYRSRLLKSGGNLTISVIKDHGYIFVGENYQVIGLLRLNYIL